MRNAQRFILARYLAFFLFCAGSFPLAYAEDWQVKRTDRAPILIKRWTEILQNEPYAQKAFRELLRLHKQPAARRSLYAKWKARYQNAPNSLSAAIIYARSLQRQGQHAESLRLWQDIAKRSTQKQAPLLRIASIYLDQKRPRDAMTTFQQLLPLVSENQRPKLLLRILEVSLKARDSASLAWTQPQIAKITWSTSQQHAIAQLYEQYQQWADASAILRPLYAKAKGAERMRLALRLSRIEMNQKRYNEALALIQESRKVGTLHDWMRWELLEREAEIYRHQKSLLTLTARLAKTWKRSKDPRELLFLARLYRENKQDSEAAGEAIVLAKRVLRLKPALREPRLWLVEHYTKEQDFSTVNEHIQALVKYGHARPSHMIQLADSFLRNSGRPLKGRWTPIQLFQSSASSYSAYRRRLYYRRRYTTPPKPTQDTWSPQAIRKSILRWDAQRRQEWTTWARYATNAARKDYNQAKKILEQTLRRYPKDWDTLFKIEYMADQMGASKLAAQSLRALERATDPDPNQLKQMHILLLQTQREEKLASLAKRALSPPLAPLQAILASTWALRPWDELRGSYQKMTRFSKTTQQTQWQRQICPPIKRILQLDKTAKMRGLVDSLRPVLRLQIYALRWHCGERNNNTRTQLERAEESLLLESDGPQKLLETYVRARLDQPLRSYLKRRKLAEKPRDLIEMFRPLLQSPWAKQATDALFAAFSGEHSESHQNARAEALLLLCQQRAHCNHVADAIGSLVKSPPKPITPLLQIIERTATYQLFPKERAAWLTQIQLLHHDDLPVQYFLATQKSLFLLQYSGLITYKDLQIIRETFAKIWVKAIVQSLALRETEPADLALWQISLRQMLYQLQSFHKERDLLFSQLLQAARRFPSIYRTVISQAIALYAYRLSLQKIAVELFSQPIQWEDLPWLEPIYNTFPPTTRNALLQQTLQTQTTHEALRLLAYLSEKYNQPDIHLRILEKMLQQRPHDTPLLYKTALLLERLGHPARAEILWMRYLQRQPDKRTPAYLTRLSKRCCVDANDRAFARRILHLSIAANGLSALWEPFQRLLPQLEPTHQQALIQQIANTPNVPHQTLQDLADLAQKKRFYQAALPLYLRLQKHTPHDPTLHQRIASLYDAQGQYKQAHTHWLQSLSKQDAAKRETFFIQQAQQYTQKNQAQLAALSYARAYQTQPTLDTPTLRERIAALLTHQKPLQAWGYWLLLSDHMDRCLTPATPHANFLPAPLPKQLWQAHIPYTGPLFSFPRCQWMLTHTTQRETLRHLADLLKQSPQQKIHLRASSEENEPDAAFLVQQRLQTLRSTLVQLGAKSEQIELAPLSAQTLCRTDDNLLQEHGISCAAFQRQAAIGESIPNYLNFLSNDADNDQIPDILDHCPLQHKTGASYRPTAPISRTRSSLFAVHQPTPPNHHNGCPPAKQSTLAFGKRLADGTLQMTRPLVFTGYSYHVPYYHRDILGQLASLLRAAPDIGNLTVEITPILPTQTAPNIPPPQPRYYGRYGRYARYRRMPPRYYVPSYARDPKRLAQLRLNSIGQILRSYKAPMHRIRLVVKPPIQQAGATPYTPPKILFRFDPTQPTPPSPAIPTNILPR